MKYTIAGTPVSSLVVDAPAEYSNLEFTGRDVRTLEPMAFANGAPLVLPADTVRLLQAAAHDANQRFPAGVAAVPFDRMVPVGAVSATGSGTTGC